MPSPKPDYPVFDMNPENQPTKKPLTLVELDENAFGSYGNPITGECNPGSEKNTFKRRI
jgi:hypothetical protein